MTLDVFAVSLSLTIRSTNPVLKQFWYFVRASPRLFVTFGPPPQISEPNLTQAVRSSTQYFLLGSIFFYGRLSTLHAPFLVWGLVDSSCDPDLVGG